MPTDVTTCVACASCNTMRDANDMRAHPQTGQMCCPTCCVVATQCTSCMSYYDNDIMTATADGPRCPQCVGIDDSDDDGDDDSDGATIDVRRYWRDGGRELLDHDYDVDWIKRDEKGNVDRHLGLEIEMNYDFDNDHGQVCDIVENYLENNCVWKYDGSIGDGAEFVTAPMTLSYWRKIGMAKMCNELKEMGVRSYESGDCGLHVHISRKQTDCGAYKQPWRTTVLGKVCQFFIQNRDFIVDFSQRGSEDVMSEWAAIPETNDYDKWISSRYRAVNMRNGNTIEFRFARGTLNYKRILATMQFCSAIVDFAAVHSYASMRLTTLIAWLGRQPRYGHLLAYLYADHANYMPRN